jgi:hypothetical protein
MYPMLPPLAVNSRMTANPATIRPGQNDIHHYRKAFPGESTLRFKPSLDRTVWLRVEETLTGYAHINGTVAAEGPAVVAHQDRPPDTESLTSRCKSPAGHDRSCLGTLSKA